MTTDRRIIDIVRRQGPISRAEAARQLALSKPTVSAVVNGLVRKGLLREVGLGRLPSGRAPRLVDFNARYAVIAGADVGATNVRLAVADLDGNVIAQRVDRTPGGDDLAERLATLVLDLCEQHAPGVPLVAATIGTPGVVSDDRILYSPNLPALEADGFLARLRAALACPLDVHNDVKLAAVGEALEHPGEPVAFLAIGTGLGTAVAVGTDVWSGHQGRAGELGYLPFHSPAGAILEDALSGVGVARLYRHFGGAGGAEEALARDDDAARRAREVMFDALALAVAALTLAYDPARIVLGGGVGLRLDAELERVRARAASELPFVAPLEVSRFGDLAALRGAVVLASRRASEELIA